jgi:zinc protease
MKIWVAAAVVALSAMDLRAQPAPAPAASKALPKADDVLEQFVKATGGRAAYEKHQSGVMKAVGEIASMGVKVEIENTMKAPNLSLLVMKMEAMGEQRSGFDGTVAWEQDPMTGLHELTGVEKAQAVREAAFNSELKWRELYKQVRSVKLETVNGRSCVQVELVPAQGHPEMEWYDLETKLLVKAESTTEGDQGTITMRMYPLEWKEYDGVKMPSAIKLEMGPVEIQAKVVSVQWNVALDDAIFRKPAAK